MEDDTYANNITQRKLRTVMTTENSFEDLLELSDRDNEYTSLTSTPTRDLNRSYPNLELHRITTQEVTELKLRIGHLETKLEIAENEIDNLLLENNSLAKNLSEYKLKVNKLTHICTSTSKKKKEQKKREPFNDLSKLDLTKIESCSSTHQSSPTQLALSQSRTPSTVISCENRETINKVQKPTTVNIVKKSTNHLEIENVTNNKVSVSVSKNNYQTSKMCIISDNNVNNILNCAKTIFPKHDVCHYCMPNASVIQLIDNLNKKIMNYTLNDFCIVLVGDKDFRVSQRYDKLVNCIKDAKLLESEQMSSKEILNFKKAMHYEHGNSYINCVHSTIYDTTTLRYSYRVVFKPNTASNNIFKISINNVRLGKSNRKVIGDIENYKYTFVQGEIINVICEANDERSIASFGFENQNANILNETSNEKWKKAIQLDSKQLESKTLKCVVKYGLNSRTANIQFALNINDPFVLGLITSDILQQYKVTLHKWIMDYQFNLGDILNLTCTGRKDGLYLWITDDTIQQNNNKISLDFTMKHNGSRIICKRVRYNFAWLLIINLYVKDDNGNFFIIVKEDGMRDIIIMAGAILASAIIVTICCLIVRYKTRTNPDKAENTYVNLRNESEAPIPQYPSQWDNMPELNSKLDIPGTTEKANNIPIYAQPNKTRKKLKTKPISSEDDDIYAYASSNKVIREIEPDGNLYSYSNNNMKEIEVDRNLYINENNDDVKPAYATPNKGIKGNKSDGNLYRNANNDIKEKGGHGNLYNNENNDSANFSGYATPYKSKKDKGTDTNLYTNNEYMNVNNDIYSEVVKLGKSIDVNYENVNSTSDYVEPLYCELRKNNS